MIAYKKYEYLIFVLVAFFTLCAVLVTLGDYNVVRIADSFYVHTADDHMITMRVAAQFANTGYPFFNANEAVAANTSLFWPLALASTIMSLGLSSENVVVLNVFLSAAIGAASVLIATLLVRGLIPKIIVGAAIALSAPFLTYVSTGWEHVPQMLLVTAGFALIILKSKEKLVIPIASLVLISFSFLLRPDSAIIIAIVGLFWFFGSENYKNSKTYIICAALLIIPASYLLLMNYYYGDWVPNTAHLKSLDLASSIKLGISHLLNPAKSSFAPYLIVLLYLLKPQNAGIRVFMYCAIAQSIYILYVGGDVFNDGRFFLFLTPILYATIISEMVQKWQNSHRSDLLAYTKIVSVLALTIFTIEGPKFLKNQIVPTEENKASLINDQLRLAGWVNSKISPEDGSIGLHYLGIGYHMPKFHIVDFLGKAEKYIAKTPTKYGPIGHNKWDYDYAYATYDISIIPIKDNIVEKVNSNNYVRRDKDLVFWEDCARYAETSGKYTYYPASYFGNSYYGAYIKNDLDWN